MNILIGNMTFRELTGAEVYAYTLAKHLTKMGHKVVITAKFVGGILTKKANEIGISVYELDKKAPNFEPDVLHLCEYYPSMILLSRYSNKIPAVATVHSEYICEKPMRSDRIKKYICIRESIIDKITIADGIQKEKCIHIPNGFDTDRFNINYPPPNNEKKVVLFVGTIDVLRKQAILHLLDMCKQSNMVAQFIGLDKGCNYLDDYSNWIKTDPSTGGIWNVEDYVKKCDMTAGVLLGRTTIEGWLCGKPGIIYDLDADGNIKSVKCYPPPADVVERYGIEGIAKRIVAVYEEAIGK